MARTTTPNSKLQSKVWELNWESMYVKEARYSRIWSFRTNKWQSEYKYGKAVIVPIRDGYVTVSCQAFKTRHCKCSMQMYQSIRWSYNVCISWSATYYQVCTQSKRLWTDHTCEKYIPWDLVCYSDSNHAGDSNTSQSISGFIYYICQVPISWRSKAQQSVTLSSSEAEWVALPEAVKEVMLISQLLMSVKIHMQSPTIVHVDNVGAIFMAQNITTTSHTKHVDIRYKFVNEYVPDGVVNIIFLSQSKIM